MLRFTRVSRIFPSSKGVLKIRKFSSDTPRVGELDQLQRILFSTKTPGTEKEKTIIVRPEKPLTLDPVEFYRNVRIVAEKALKISLEEAEQKFSLPKPVEEPEDDKQDPEATETAEGASPASEETEGTDILTEEAKEEQKEVTSEDLARGLFEFRYFLLPENLQLALKRATLSQAIPNDPLLDMALKRLFAEHYVAGQEGRTGYLENEQMQFTRKTINISGLWTANEIKAVFPEGLPGKLSTEENLVDGNSPTVIREETINVIERLQDAQKKKFTGVPPCVFVDGDKLTGKSAILAQAIYWARKNGWLVVSIPNATKWCADELIEPSRREYGFFNQPLTAVSFCSALLGVHGDKLAKLPLRLQWTLPKFERQSTSTLKTLLEFGTKNDEQATDCIYYFRRELDLVTEFPILIVVDGVNAFWNPSETIGDPDPENPLWYPRINPQKLVLSNIFMDFDSHALMNGTVLASTNRSVPIQEFEKHKSFPRERTVVLPQRFRRDEVMSLAGSLFAAGYFGYPYPTIASIDYGYHISLGNPHHFRKYFAYLG